LSFRFSGLLALALSWQSFGFQLALATREPGRPPPEVLFCPKPNNVSFLNFIRAAVRPKKGLQFLFPISGSFPVRFRTRLSESGNLFGKPADWLSADCTSQKFFSKKPKSKIKNQKKGQTSKPKANFLRNCGRGGPPDRRTDPRDNWRRRRAGDRTETSRRRRRASPRADPTL